MKSTQRVSDLKALSPDQLNDELLNLKKEQFNLRFQGATGQLENVARVREVRRDIARVRTLQRSKTLQQAKGEKTIVVKVERRFTHPVMKKTVRRSKNYHAHDEANVAKVGQTVFIEECRPFSKTKTWKLVEGDASVQAEAGEAA